MRCFTAAAPGYGYVADDVPELAIAVFPEFRGQQVGTLLLGSIIARAERDGLRAISLSVNRENPAKRLYVRYGFEVVGRARRRPHHAPRAPLTPKSAPVGPGLAVREATDEAGCPIRPTSR